MQNHRIQQQPKDSAKQKHSADKNSESRIPSDRSSDLLLRLSAMGKASPPDIPLTPQNILNLQQTVGNQAFGHMIQTKPISTQITPIIQKQDKEGQKSSNKKIIPQKNGDIWVLVSWLDDKSKHGLNKSKIYAPEVIREILKKWRQSGTLGWMTDKDIKAAAEKLWIYGPVSPLKKYDVIKGFDAEILSHFSLPSKAKDIQMLPAADYTMIILIKGGVIPKGKPNAIKKLGKKAASVIEQQTGMPVDDTGKGLIIEDLNRAINRDWSKDQKTLVLQINRDTSNMLFDIQQNRKWDRFVDKLKKENKVVFSYKEGAAGAKGKGGKKGRRLPAWAGRLKKKVRALIKETRERDPKTEYLPDRFYIYFSENKQAWRGGGVIYGIAGEKKLGVGVDISKK